MTRSYALGDSANELARLARQAKLVDPITRRLFREAGIEPGMRVLDLGSGAGDVAILLSGLVGDTGEVVGTDISAPALEVARRRVAALGLKKNVAFWHGDPSATAFDRPFDAVAGRYVLMFLPDPGEMLRRLARHLKPGGVAVFHEPAWEGGRSVPSIPGFDLSYDWCGRALRALGARTEMGFDLARVFGEAGLKSPQLRLEATIVAGAEAEEVINLYTGLVGTLGPDLVQFGIASETDIAVTADPARLLDEVTQSGAVLIGRAEVGGWARR